MPWDAEVEVALAAVRQAASVCRAVQRDVDPLTLEKKDRSPVTVADFASQALVARALLEAFPDDPLVGEEDAVALREPDNAARREQVRARVAGEVEASTGDVLRWMLSQGVDQTLSCYGGRIQDGMVAARTGARL